MSDTIISALKAALKTAMREKNKDALNTIRMALAAIKQIEVDERIEVDDAHTIQVLDKLIKQRRDAAEQYQNANREDLATTELNEIEILKTFMPEPLTGDKLTEMIRSAITEANAQSMKDMGNVMAILRPQVQGRADMSQVSQQVKAQLT